MKAYKYTLRQNIFYILSPLFSLFQPFFAKPKRLNGISVMIRLFNEEYSIAESLLSLNEFADEVIVINNGCTDSSMEKIEEVKPNLKYNLNLYDNFSKDYVEISNFGLEKTSYQWIVRWDGDFIAYTSGSQDINRLRAHLLSLPQHRYYLIYPRILCFAGDAKHVQKGKEYHSEQYIHSYHPLLRYIKTKRYEVLKVPFFYQIQRIHTVFFVHLGTVKPLRRLLYRSYWGIWWKQKRYLDYPNLDDYIDSVILGNEKLDKLELIKKELQEQIEQTRTFTVEEFGEYPALMKKFIENPPFTILEKAGKPYSRSDF
jgi:glycosyltransferase involved in cell wall biosynthesis